MTLKPEARFISQFRQEVLRQNRHAFFYKIPDSFRTGNKPFDAILDVGPRVYYLEFKQVPATLKSFSPRSLFRAHQIRNLQQLQKSKPHCACWGVIRKGTDVYLVNPEQLGEERLEFEPLVKGTLKEIVCRFVSSKNVFSQTS